MDIASVRRHRLRSHRLTAPARSIEEAAAHMTATQAQEFWGGRWALAARTAPTSHAAQTHIAPTEGHPRLSDVDAAFSRPGGLIRSWTQRGTLHILPASDLAWILEATRERQERQHASIHRRLGIDAGTLARAEQAVRPALSGGNRLTRAEFAAVLEAAGIDTSSTRGNHIFSALALRLVVLLGPVVPREGAPTRDQFVVAPEEWIVEHTQPADPLAELFIRYLRGHAPASVDDFGWWAGLSRGLSHRAREGAGDAVIELGDDLFALAEAPSDLSAREPAPDPVQALPPFDEYFLSYRDRTIPCTAEIAARIGPTPNGMVRPVLVAGGEIVGVWSHSVAVGRHHLAPAAELFSDLDARDADASDVDAADVDAALARFARFVTG